MMSISFRTVHIQEGTILSFATKVLGKKKDFPMIIKKFKALVIQNTKDICSRQMTMLSSYYTSFTLLRKNVDWVRETWQTTTSVVFQQLVECT